MEQGLCRNEVKNKERERGDGRVCCAIDKKKKKKKCCFE